MAILSNLRLRVHRPATFFFASAILLLAGCDGRSPKAPTVSLGSTSLSIPSGASTVLTWSAANASTCTASGAWSGQRATSGSESTAALTADSTFVLACSGATGTATASVTVSMGSTAALSGLDFPGNAAAKGTIRFRFLNPLAIYPATYIWRVYPRQQAGYYTTFFWGNDDGKNNLDTFLWMPGRDADSYYGAHPYPNPPPSGTAHDWEISVERMDFVNGRVVYDRWYTQALRVWIDADGSKRHEFYWDLPSTDASRKVTRTSPPDWGNRMPPVPALTWGDAPWAPGNEVYNGVIRGIQIYSRNLSLPDILAEISEPLSTAAGKSSVWYINLNPTPDDVSDKSGRGNHPSWVGAGRPRLWTGY